MTNEKLYEVLGDISDRHIKEARAERKKPARTGWRAIAACFLIAVIGAAAFAGGLLGSKTDNAVLDSGETITFVKSAMPAANIDLDVRVRALSNDEIKMLFPALPVTANAYFDADTHDTIGFEGSLSNVKLVVAAPGINLVDTKIEGSEYVSTVSGVPVLAGYFTANKTVIYYASFDIGGNSIYAELSGAKDNSENIKNDLAKAIERLIANGEFDLGRIKE
ncbi:MAG: hypothetical protein ACOX81_07710 [Candidatus Heteroscillospira sp.]|jgi:hypothetical protein